MNAIVKLQKLPWKFILNYHSKLVNILFWFDIAFEIESKYHRKTVVLLLIALVLSLQDVVLSRSMFFLTFYKQNRCYMISIVML